MAKLLEDVLVIKISKLVKDSDTSKSAIDDEQREMLEQTVPTLLDEVLNDNNLIIEIDDA